MNYLNNTKTRSFTGMSIVKRYFIRDIHTV